MASTRQQRRPRTSGHTVESHVTAPALGAHRVFHPSRSRLPEPFRPICIKSCKFCISFACNVQVTRADFLKMAFPAGRGSLKGMPQTAFSTLTPQHIQTVARLQTRTCRSQAVPFVRLVEALCDARPQALFRQTPRGHSPAVCGPAFSEMTLFNFGAFR